MPVTGYLSDAADADQAAPGFDPMQPAFANPLAFAPEPPEEEPETMLTEVDHDRLDPMLLTGTVAAREASADELLAAATRAEQRLDLGDRAGAYLELYQATGNEQLLLQTQTTTYSGALGGMALEGNFRAKMANPDNYEITLDKFSNDIDRAVVELAKRKAERELKMEFLAAGQIAPPEELAPFDADAPRPPANLDRVFDYACVLYQVDEESLFRQNGVEFEKLTDYDALGTRIEGADYVRKLDNMGDAVDFVINDWNFSDAAAREAAFQEFLSQGVIVPLTADETAYYDSALERLNARGLGSPYQSSNNALTGLQDALVSP